MEIIYQGIVLLLFFSFLKAENQSAPPNPECKGMNTAAKNLEGGIQMLFQTSPHCKPNEQCTGVKCTWPTNGFLEVDLRYCNSPVTYHVYFKQDYNKEKNFTLKQQDEQVLYTSKLFEIKIIVNKLNRSGNTVTTKVGLLVCHQIFPGQKCHTISLMPEQTFCICAAALFVIFVVVGVSVYWKKYHHRSRLRAAYYNDISMHDPLYEDFGPEVA
ncbi:uncharacterized protein [Montipora capricornis]|uniref:uncharacterized protein isoform X2 n=1 Tax=Montipora capricornis TaxID=246305 RepID=UPI0035F13F2D